MLKMYHIVMVIITIINFDKHYLTIRAISTLKKLRLKISNNRYLK